MKPGGGAVPLLLRCTLGPPGPQAQGLAHKAWPTNCKTFCMENIGLLTAEGGGCVRDSGGRGECPVLTKLGGNLR